MTTTPHSQTLIILLRRGLREMLDELVARLHAAGYTGIRPAHSQVMENIDRDGTRLTELAARASMSHPSMLELVAGLERLGYVERAADPTDARARLVRLTAEGRGLQLTAMAEIAQVERAWLERLARDGDPDLADFLARRCSFSTAAGGHSRLAADPGAPRSPE